MCVGRDEIRDVALGLEMEGLENWVYEYQKVLIDEKQNEIVGFWKQIANKGDGTRDEIYGIGGSWFRLERRAADRVAARLLRLRPRAEDVHQAHRVRRPHPDHAEAHRAQPRRREAARATTRSARAPFRSGRLPPSSCLGCGVTQLTRASSLCLTRGSSRKQVRDEDKRRSHLGVQPAVVDRGDRDRRSRQGRGQDPDGSVGHVPFRPPPGDRRHPDDGLPGARRPRGRGHRHRGRPRRRGHRARRPRRAVVHPVVRRVSVVSGRPAQPLRPGRRPARRHRGLRRHPPHHRQGPARLPDDAAGHVQPVHGGAQELGGEDRPVDPVRGGLPGGLRRDHGLRLGRPRRRHPARRRRRDHRRRRRRHVGAAGRGQRRRAQPLRHRAGRVEARRGAEVRCHPRLPRHRSPPSPASPRSPTA